MAKKNFYFPSNQSTEYQKKLLIFTNTFRLCVNFIALYCTLFECSKCSNTVKLSKSYDDEIRLNNTGTLGEVCMRCVSASETTIGVYSNDNYRHVIWIWRKAKKGRIVPIEKKSNTGSTIGKPFALRTLIFVILASSMYKNTVYIFIECN